MFASERRAKAGTCRRRDLFESESRPKSGIKEGETRFNLKDGIVCFIITLSSLVLVVYLFFSAVGRLLNPFEYSLWGFQMYIEYVDTAILLHATSTNMTLAYECAVTSTGLDLAVIVHRALPA
jgi:hypothetical protein